MKSHTQMKGLFWLLILTIGFTVSMMAVPGQTYNASISASQVEAGKKEEQQEDQLPIVTYTTSEQTEAVGQSLRSARSSRYEKRTPQPISELPDGIDVLPLISHWGWGLPALPSVRSDAVVIGEVIEAQAHLSNDKTGIYSEFTIRVTEVLKNCDQASVIVSQQITAEREGGAVQFPSGRVQQYRIAKQRMPGAGRKYVLFLKYNEQGQDFSILTGYELREGRATPLDTLDQFAVYKGIDESSFLKAVRDSIAHPAPLERR